MSKSTDGSKTCLTGFCFFSFGLWYSFVRFVLVLATEDILSGTLLSSTIVLISYSVPDLTAKVLSPFIVRKISFLASFTLFVIFMSLAMLLLVVIESPYFRISAAILCGFCNGFGTIMFSRMIPYYDEIEKNVSYFQMGGNCSAMIVSLFYTGLTTWLCVAPRTTIASCIPTCLLLLVFYAIIDKEPLKIKEQKNNTRMYKVHYAPVSTTDDEQVSNNMMDKLFRKLSFFSYVFPYLSYFALNYFSTFLSMNSAVTTLIFPSAPFLPRDHYQYYRLLSDLGTFLGGTELLFVSMFSSDWQSFFKVRRIWVLVLLNVGHLFFFIFASWYHFVSNVAVILVLCFTQGFIHGSTAVNCLASCSDCFTSVSDKGTAIGIVEVGSSIGRLSSGLMGLFLETNLREHCTNRLMLGRLSCLARFGSISAWNENRLDCKL